MGEFRTTEQIAANELDRRLDALATEIREAGKTHNNQLWEEVAQNLMGERWALRQRLHPKDGR